MTYVEKIENILKDDNKVMVFGRAVLTQHHYRGVVTSVEMNNSKQVIIRFYNRMGFWTEIFGLVRDIDPGIVEKL